ncbi:SWIM zinc finger domain-containing protein [Bradyrhizobium sp. Pha-3]|uniref:SWIM zinc finger family protein n=1 Tax=Bradyrhizobium sp. Pha-3 TaxID=208375 RepID=UPI0035D45EB8
MLRTDRFDLAALREVAGDKTFARGSAYQADRRVEIITIDEARVVARVAGTEIYRCELTGQGEIFSGACTCQAFADRGFCKHLTAVALTVNNLEPDELGQASNRLGKIRDHLRAKGIDRLVEMIIGLAERAPKLLEELELSAALDSADDATLSAQLKRAITDATRVRGYIEYRDMRDWVRHIDGALDRISVLLGGGRALLVLELLDHFFGRMDEALTKVDDSDGGGGACYARACEIHLAACEQAKPDSIELARVLFARELNSDRDFFFGASETYADVLGTAGLAEYRRLATEAWQKTRSRRGRRTEIRTGGEYALRAMMERFAERDGDVDAGIAIRASDLSTAHDYLGVAQLCLDNGREQEALKWAEEGLWKFEDEPDQRLVLFTCGLLQRSGRNEDANERLWKLFSREPSVELYLRLKSDAGAGNAQILVRDKAIAALSVRAGKSGSQSEWSVFGAAEVLVRVLMAEGLLADAWAAADKHGCREILMEELARASEADLPAEALKAYAELVERKVRLGGQGNYSDAHAMIKRMRRLDGAIQHSAYLADLMTRHKAKRNFIKLLTSKKVS